MAKQKQHGKKEPLNDLTGSLILKNIENGINTPNDPLVSHYLKQGTLSREQIAAAQARFNEAHRRGQLRMTHFKHGGHR